MIPGRGRIVKLFEKRKVSLTERGSRRIQILVSDCRIIALTNIPAAFGRSGAHLMRSSAVILPHRAQHLVQSPVSCRSPMHGMFLLPQSGFRQMLSGERLFQHYKQQQADHKPT